MARTAARAARCTSRTSRSACWARTAWSRTGCRSPSARRMQSKLHGAQAAWCACFFGDGAVNRGPFLEALNWAAIHALPVLFVCEDNRWSATTPTDAMTAGEGALARAAAIGVPGEQVDGNDVFAVDAVTQKLIAEVKAHGPEVPARDHLSLQGPRLGRRGGVSRRRGGFEGAAERPAGSRFARKLPSREAERSRRKRNRKCAARFRSRPTAPWPDAREAYRDVQDTGGGQWR